MSTAVSLPASNAPTPEPALLSVPEAAHELLALLRDALPAEPLPPYQERHEIGAYDVRLLLSGMKDLERALAADGHAAR